MKYFLCINNEPHKGSNLAPLLELYKIYEVENNQSMHDIRLEKQKRKYGWTHKRFVEVPYKTNNTLLYQLCYS